MKIYPAPAEKMPWEKRVIWFGILIVYPLFLLALITVTLLLH